MTRGHRFPRLEKGSGNSLAGDPWRPIEFIDNRMRARALVKRWIQLTLCDAHEVDLEVREEGAEALRFAFLHVTP